MLYLGGKGHLSPGRYPLTQYPCSNPNMHVSGVFPGANRYYMEGSVVR